MVHELAVGDYLVFQLESGYGLLRVLGVDDGPTDTVWHLAAYENLFMDVESADAAVADPACLVLTKPHVALTERAFGSTQVARLANQPLNQDEEEQIRNWDQDPDRMVYDRSIRLLLGLR